MAYQALYRKWRPNTFDSVVGQEAITDTLKNAIKRGTISHAFLFAGPRGTGKTSCAKIFAKALNCTNLQDGEPCNKCENCLAADSGSMPDIMEIDAASNNGVDEIRDIRDKVKYAPTQGKYKVYIIDEVHMLSMGAFNALLKTLEEPPEHVVFILATTELQKVPATIISRTQRYNFKRISKKDLENRMKFILNEEKIDYEEKALSVIAQVADGGMRDSLSILDQLLSYEKGKINYKDALQITGFAAKERIEKILLAILSQNVSQALSEAKLSLQDGASSKNILDELIDMTTNALMVIKTNEKNESNFLTEEFIEQIKNIPEKRYFDLINLANTALKDLRYTNQQQIPLEVFLVEASTIKEKVQPVNTSINSELDAELKNLRQQVIQLTEKINNLPAQTATAQTSSSIDDVKFTSKKTTKSQTQNKTSVNTKSAKKLKRSEEKNRKEVYQVLENATKKDLQAIKNVWPDLRSILEVSERAILEVLEPVAASSEKVVLKCKYMLWFENTTDSEFIIKVKDNIEKFTKHSYGIVLVPDTDWLQVRSEFVKSHKDELLAKKKQQLELVKNENETDSQESKEVVEKAKALFGDVVKVKD
ncbi:DNA polymerase III subunit gamma/tau [Lactobacillus sp. LL6]|uniref:DNA polymerase III subunit gamma/tau n=1 Tax=Lactobacillus sp. LL6 TaxID=2596827 RepID=UPI00118697F1|nr:DNA polymerase III subunit gamma/tau [Lactobacillus sp. LL6]TSO25893.1 DNA polymerase III subunit gamma/tau [Lactobacillus sp. LL6]